MILEAGSFMWDMISGVWNLMSRTCPLYDENQETDLEFFMHENHPAAKLAYHGSIVDPKELPAINMIYIGGIGNRFECCINRAYLLSKTYYNGLRYANVFTLDHMGYSDMEDLISSIQRLVHEVKLTWPNVPVVLVGFSLGTGLLIQVALREQVDGLILFNAYEHPSDLLEKEYLRPVTDYFVGVSLDSLEGLAQLKGRYHIVARQSKQQIQVETHTKMPVYIFTSLNDGVIMPKHGRKLAQEATKNPNLQVHYYAHPGDHSDIFHQDVLLSIFSSLDKTLDFN